ncbi:MAG: DUF2817 domain-containing protein [Planctomycetales bacterium]|nr:DUF2817 domain-containing protein [Planctomycetales bacterium]
MRYADVLPCYRSDYATARQLFLQRAGEHGHRVESFEHPRVGPQGETLALDAAWCGEHAAQRLLILSSGLHGLEGAAGSAMQAALLDGSLHELAMSRGWSVLQLHALNPFGFAYNRRWDEDNVDANRNFALPGGPGVPAGNALYRELDSLLNPQRPAAFDTWRFYAGAARAVLQHGFANLKQAVAEGQYEFPRGLFYGGREPCWTQRCLVEKLPKWIAGRREVVHFDIHSGLGRWSDLKLLLDYPIRDWQRSWLQRYPESLWEDAAPAGTAYHALGGLGRWGDARFNESTGSAADASARYLYLCAEFGTYGPLRVLSALRAENCQWHARGGSCDPSDRVVAHVREMFCPRSAAWRRATMKRLAAALERVFEA